MSNMKYDAVLSITPSTNQGDAPTEELWNIRIRSFSVVGGASRSINLDSTDEISISSEFEQARTHKNITLFVPPTKDFLAVKLMALRTSGIKFFSIFFMVNIYSSGKRTHSLILENQTAWLAKTPIPVGNKEALLMLEVRFNDAQLRHGKLNQTKREFVHKEI